MPKLISSGQLTLTDLNDAIVAATEPVNPHTDQLWIDRSVTPNLIKQWNGSGWVTIGEISEEGTGDVVDAINTSLLELAADDKITRFERGLVRQEVLGITGDYHAATASMPTLATIDGASYNRGALHSLRKQARNIGVATGSGTNYALLGAAYTTLANYLNGLNPKPWNTDSTTTLTVTKSTWDTNWRNYYTYFSLLQVDVQDRQKALSDSAQSNAIAAVSNAVAKESATITNPMTINAPIATLGLPEFEGKHVDSWSLPDYTSWSANMNRYQPITNPTFDSGLPFTMNVRLYGDGTNNDVLTWDTKGNIIITRKWIDTLLDGGLNWEFVADNTGFKQVKVAGFSPGVVDGTVIGVKYDGTLLTRVTGTATLTLANRIKLTNTDNTLYITVADTDSGWGESYTPLPEEIRAYFYGWKMCNGTYGVAYTGTGSKMWYPIGDTNLDRATALLDGVAVNGIPDTPSPAVNENSIKQYQVLYRLATPSQESGFSFDGVLALTQGSNTINITYPPYSPTITKGVVKYATNLATVQQDLSYLIPTLQKRISNAEERITDDAIIETVTQSVSYQTALTGKADVGALSDYATSDAVGNLAEEVDSLANAVNAIDLSDFVTSTQVETTANGIVEKFYKAGGMNQIKNSVGYAGKDFWDPYVANDTTETISNDDLDSLGFGSGFHFKANGLNKGIKQKVKVIPNQHYTLSWYLNKMTSGTGSNYRFFIQILEGGSIVAQISDNSTVKTTGYEASYINNIIPKTNEIEIRFIGYASVEAILSGIMFTIGDVPIQWTLSAGEAYNTFITMNLNGIKVSQFDENRNLIGYTLMSPTEFAGYYRNNGIDEKVFYLNGDYVVTKKLQANDEISMGRIKIIPVDLTSNKGWAFIPN
jgi:hypothetical protein